VVINRMRERVRIEQTAQELKDQNEANAIELSKLELGAACSSKQPHELRAIEEEHCALRSVSQSNVAQRRRLERKSMRSELKENDMEGKERFVSLLAAAKAVIEGEENRDKCGSIERRLLHMQHANSLLELEKVEAEQASALLQAAVRRHELALRKQALQLDVHTRALACAEAVLAKNGLMDVWISALGPLAKLIPGRARSEEPSVDELIAELNAAPLPQDRLPAVAVANIQKVGAVSPVDAELQAIDKGYSEMKASLSRSSDFESYTSSDRDEDNDSQESASTDRSEIVTAEDGPSSKTCKVAAHSEDLVKSNVGVAAVDEGDQRLISSIASPCRAGFSSGGRLGAWMQN